MPVGQAAKDYLAKSVNPTLLKGLTELCKQKPKDPVVRQFNLAKPFHIVSPVFNWFITVQSFEFIVTTFLFQIWLADWLLENNPNKPRVRDVIVEEA